MKNFLKNFIYHGLSFLNLNQAVILMYHSIDNNEEFFTVSPSNLEKQMAFLAKNNFNVVKLEDLEKFIKNNSLITKTIILTFDDGYRDNYINAFPILRKYNFPATFFIPSNFIGKTIEGRKGTQMEILRTNEIKELADSNLIEIGSHALNHRKLSALSDREIEEELKYSKERLMDISNKKAVSFAYPRGDYNEVAERLAKKYYRNICTVSKGRIKFDFCASSLKRNSIDSQVSMAQFKGIVKYSRI